MFRYVLLVTWLLCHAGCADVGTGKIIRIEESKDRYFELREGRDGYVLSTNVQLENRPDLTDLREVHGDLNFICSEIHGVTNPRIVIESSNTRHYQVVYPQGNREVLRAFAQPLGLVVSNEVREIQAITIRVSERGHDLKLAAKESQINLDDVLCDADGSWPLDGINLDELAQFLEGRYRRPVVNLTSLKGRWEILLSEKAGKAHPETGETVALDELRLEMRWESVSLPVTIVKDGAK